MKKTINYGGSNIILYTFYLLFYVFIAKMPYIFYYKYIEMKIKKGNKIGNMVRTRVLMVVEYVEQL